MNVMVSVAVEYSVVVDCEMLGTGWIMIGTVAVVNCPVPVGEAPSQLVVPLVA